MCTDVFVYLKMSICSNFRLQIQPILIDDIHGNKEAFLSHSDLMEHTFGHL